jgi:hypothetical protein
MKILAAAILTLFLAPAAFAGGGLDDIPQQQMAPQTKVVVVQPDTGSDNGWVVPVAVAALGVVGVVGAAYVTNRRKGD